MAQRYPPKGSKAPLQELGDLGSRSFSASRFKPSFTTSQPPTLSLKHWNSRVMVLWKMGHWVARNAEAAGPPAQAIYALAGRHCHNTM